MSTTPEKPRPSKPRVIPPTDNPEIPDRPVRERPRKIDAPGEPPVPIKSLVARISLIARRPA